MPFRRMTLEDALREDEPTQDDIDRGRVVNNQSITGQLETLGPLRTHEDTSIVPHAIRRTTSPDQRFSAVERAEGRHLDTDPISQRLIEFMGGERAGRAIARGTSPGRSTGIELARSLGGAAAERVGDRFQQGFGSITRDEGTEEGEGTEPVRVGEEDPRVQDLIGRLTPGQTLDVMPRFDPEGTRPEVSGFETPGPVEEVQDPSTAGGFADRLGQTLRVFGQRAGEGAANLVTDPVFQDFLVTLGQAMTGEDAPVDVIGDRVLEQNRASRQREFISRMQAGESPQEIDIPGMGREEQAQAIQIFSELERQQLQERRVQVEEDRLALEGWRAFMPEEPDEIEGTLQDGTRRAIMEEVGVSLLERWQDTLSPEEQQALGVSRMLSVIQNHTGPDNQVNWAAVRSDLQPEDQNRFNNLLQLYALANIHQDIDPTVLTAELQFMSPQEINQMHTELEQMEEDRRQGRQREMQIPDALQQRLEQRTPEGAEAPDQVEDAQVVPEGQEGEVPAITDPDQQRQLEPGTVFIDSDGAQKMIIQGPDGRLRKMRME